MKKIFGFITVILLAVFFVGVISCGKKAVSVKSVTLNKTTLSIEMGGTESLVATIQPTNATIKVLMWKSSDSTVVSVDPTGKIKGLKVGKATITVLADLGKKSAKCEVTVTGMMIPVKGVSIKEELSLLLGTTEVLVPTFIPENASNKEVKWASQDSTIASVDKTGKVKALKLGKTKIIVTTVDGGMSATCALIVVDKKVSVTGVSINKTAVNLLVGGTEILKAIISPENATNKNVVWSSSNEEIATIDKMGRLPL